MYLSECCGARVYDDTDICTECYEHCEVIDDADDDYYDPSKDFTFKQYNA